MVQPIDISDLGSALHLGPHELVSLVGGGGKTTVLFELGRQIDGLVVLTTTTKMHSGRTAGYHVVNGPSDRELIDALTAYRTVLVWRHGARGKAHGVDRASCDRWFDLADHVIVEADGARQKPLTAPGPFEPVVPTATTLLVACVGADALGRVIADQCHRPMRVAAVAGCSPYQRLTPQRLVSLLLSDRGLMKGRPADARFAVVVNNVGPAEQPFVQELVDIIDGRARLVAIAPHGGPATDW